MSNKQSETIDIRKVLKKIVERKKLFYITLPIAFIVSALLILCVPRYYVTSVKLAPESEMPSSAGGLGSLASSFGINLSNIKSTDAISPILYPDLMDDNKFIVDLFPLKIESQDGKIKTNYHDYLEQYQKAPWWQSFRYWLMEKLSSSDENGVKGGKGDTNPYNLSKHEDDIVGAVRENIDISVDKKTGVITISTKAQDPLICKTIADSVTTRLQAFITQYRTNKARTDLEYYKMLMAEAKHNYEKARQRYGSYADANTDVILESIRSKTEDLENDMQLKLNTYTAINTQLQAAAAKVQERTPAFTILKGASVPIKPAGPKRMLFVLGMMFLTFCMTILYIFKDELKMQ